MWPLNCFNWCRTLNEEEFCPKKGSLNLKPLASLKDMPSAVYVINSSTSFINIPKDVQVVIFEILSFNERIKCTMVSKQWGNVVKETPFYKYVKNLEKCFFELVGGKDLYEKEKQTVLAPDNENKSRRLTKELLSTSNLDGLYNLFYKDEKRTCITLDEFIAQKILLEYMLNKIIHTPNLCEKNANEVCESIVHFIKMNAFSPENKANILLKQFISFYPILNENLIYQKMIASCDTTLYSNDLPANLKVDRKISTQCETMKLCKEQYELFEPRLDAISEFYISQKENYVLICLWKDMIKTQLKPIKRLIDNFSLSPFDEKLDAEKIGKIQTQLSKLEVDLIGQEECIVKSIERSNVREKRLKMIENERKNHLELKYELQSISRKQIQTTTSEPKEDLFDEKIEVLIKELETILPKSKEDQLDEEAMAELIKDLEARTS